MAGSAHVWADGDAPNTTYLNAIPYGVMGYVNGAVAQAGISAVTDLTGLTVTFTAISTRLYRTTVNLPRAVNSAVASEQRLTIADGAGTALKVTTVTTASGGAAMHHLEYTETGITGSTTRKARLQTAAGTVDTTAGFLGNIVVEDLGPA